MRGRSGSERIPVLPSRAAHALLNDNTLSCPVSLNLQRGPQAEMADGSHFSLTHPGQASRAPLSLTRPGPLGGECLLTLPKGPENSKDFNSGTEESAGNF